MVCQVLHEGPLYFFSESWRGRGEGEALFLIICDSPNYVKVKAVLELSVTGE